MKRALATFVLLFATWFLWSGHTTPLLVGFGLVACAIVVYVAQRLGVLDDEGYPFHLGIRVLVFIPWLVWAIAKANFDVAKIILSRRLPIRPHLVRVPASQKTTLGQVIHANTITITPGTITLDLGEDEMLVHALTDEAAADDVNGAIDRRICSLERTD